MLVVVRYDHMRYAVKVCMAKQVVYAYMYFVKHEAFSSGLSETQIPSFLRISTCATKPNAIYGAKTI